MSEEKKKRYLHVNSSPSAPFIVKRIPRCFALHTGNAFTEECFILLQISLVVWQKNGKRTDYVYFQKRAYQSVIRPLWCSHLYLQLMIRVISVRSPWMYCFPSRRGCLEYCLCVCVFACALFSKWYEWPFQIAKQSLEARKKNHSTFLLWAESNYACSFFFAFFWHAAEVQAEIVAGLHWLVD